MPQTREFWIQIEPHDWDLCPNNTDRMTGQTIKDREGGSGPVTVTMHSPVTGATHTRKMFKPLAGGALILRRYTENWAAPDDRKVNPWDLNEHDPTDTGTMGTIPGPVIECEVGDTVIVHFRNMDHRTESIFDSIAMADAGTGGMSMSGMPTPGMSMAGTRLTDIASVVKNTLGDLGVSFPFTRPIDYRKRAHSLHPHGFVFAPTSDGAYPLSPQDTTQPIPPGEAAAWAEVGVHGFKQGDRVPSGGTFTYTWQTLGWPSTAGVWLYHDHSINDEENVNRGAIGIIVIHNTNEADQQQDVEPSQFPNDDPNGSPVTPGLIRFADAFERAIQVASGALMPHPGDPAPMEHGGHMRRRTAKSKDLELSVLRSGDAEFAVSGNDVIGLLLPHFRTPPDKALYLQLFHSVEGGAMCINGRQYLGNTPTMVAKPTTLMRFGVVGMGSDFHTFHIHGHRWTLNGPDGNDLISIMNSPQTHPVSQFEDTRTFGPANSFAFSIDEGNGFMRASPANGEWHMHCHVLNHMMTGMMGSLLIVNGGEVFLGLPHGVPMPDMSGSSMGGGGGMGGGAPMSATVHVKDVSFSPNEVTIKKGGTVTWSIEEANHTVTSNPGTQNAQPPSSEHFSFGTATSTLPVNAPNIAHTFPNTGDFAYHCEFHGAAAMSGVVHVVDN